MHHTQIKALMVAVFGVLVVEWVHPSLRDEASISGPIVATASFVSCSTTPAACTQQGLLTEASSSRLAELSALGDGQSKTAELAYIEAYDRPVWQVWADDGTSAVLDARTGELLEVVFAAD